MMWRCFSGFGMRLLYQINGIMDRFVYKDILKNVLAQYTDNIMPLKCIFQHDNDPEIPQRL